MKDNTITALRRLKARADANESMNRQAGVDYVPAREINRGIYLKVVDGPPYRYEWSSVHTPQAVPTYYLELTVNMDPNGRTMPMERIELTREQVTELRNQLNNFLEWSAESPAQPEGTIN